MAAAEIVAAGPVVSRVVPEVAARDVATIIREDRKLKQPWDMALATTEDKGAGSVTLPGKAMVAVAAVLVALAAQDQQGPLGLPEARAMDAHPLLRGQASRMPPVEMAPAEMAPQLLE